MNEQAIAYRMGSHIDEHSITEEFQFVVMSLVNEWENNAHTTLHNTTHFVIIYYAKNARNCIQNITKLIYIPWSL